MASNLQVKNALSATAQFVQDQDGNTSPLALSTDAVRVGGNGSRGQVAIFDENSSFTINLGGAQGPGRIGLGGNGSDGVIDIFDANTNFTIRLGGAEGPGSIVLGGNGSRGQLAIRDENSSFTINLGGAQGPGRIGLGGNGSRGQVAIFDENTNFTINLGGAEGPGRIGLGGNGSDGVIDIFDANTNQTIKIDGQTGDVQLLGGDCAEDFDISSAEPVAPGTVMVLGDENTLEPCRQSYDKRVAGVLSGAGDYRPGIVLDKQPSQGNRSPVALLGKVFCRVDAGYGPVAVGDLLTTSDTVGHARKAADPLKAFGSVIGKALRPLEAGQGLIPILIALQ